MTVRAERVWSAIAGVVVVAAVLGAAVQN